MKTITLSMVEEHYPSLTENFKELFPEGFMSLTQGDLEMAIADNFPIMGVLMSIVGRGNPGYEDLFRLQRKEVGELDQIMGGTRTIQEAARDTARNERDQALKRLEQELAEIETRRKGADDTAELLEIWNHMTLLEREARQIREITSRI